MINVHLAACYSYVLNRVDNRHLELFTSAVCKNLLRDRELVILSMTDVIRSVCSRLIDRNTGCPHASVRKPEVIVTTRAESARRVNQSTGCVLVIDSAQFVTLIENANIEMCTVST